MFLEFEFVGFILSFFGFFFNIRVLFLDGNKFIGIILFVFGDLICVYELELSSNFLVGFVLFFLSFVLRFG